MSDKHRCHDPSYSLLKRDAEHAKFVREREIEDAKKRRAKQ